mgnify:CR=1 FL=1
MEQALSLVEKPARYTGGEWNVCVKEWESVPCHFALSLPDVYEVGMSNLGLAILYAVLNKRHDTACERVYAPWSDMEKIMRARELALVSLETARPLKDFDLWGFSLQYEMGCTNVLNMLELAGVPLWAKDRGDVDPFIVGGGPCVYNVEPVADFFDFFRRSLFDRFYFQSRFILYGLYFFVRICLNSLYLVVHLLCVGFPKPHEKGCYSNETSHTTQNEFRYFHIYSR